MKISVIIAVYNGVKVIEKCLLSLSKQTKKIEIIVVNDGSKDDSKLKIENLKLPFQNQKLIFLEQKHLGPGAARNSGAKHASGEILVFVDADMTFSPEFVNLLVKPIEEGKTKGTFTKEEYVANWGNIWARCWNYNQGIADNRRLKKDYPDTAPVFRAILTSEFKKVGGFNTGVGWADDWTLSQKLSYQATATKAVCYHKNPDSLTDVFIQARWMGKNVFLTKNIFVTLLNCLRFSLPISVASGLTKSIKFTTSCFLVFKIVYDLAMTIGLTETLFCSRRNK